MNILICVKQVPDTTEIKVDPVTNTLMRAGVPSIVNPFDACALETAARIKDETPDTKIVIVSMGPEQAKVALTECLAVGADRAYLISGRGFGGSDTLATSYILSCAVRKLEELEGKFDIIFCGKQAIDGDTAQVGPELAEHLGLAQVTCALEAKTNGNTVQVRRKTERGSEILGVEMPCLITMTKTAYEPRYASSRKKREVAKQEIPTLDENSFEIDLTRAGLKGSPTKVKKTFTIPQNSTGVIFHEATERQSTISLFELLVKGNILQLGVRYGNE
ncbi:electron transfer flavoprotein subunit beta/FixA family protein [Acetobacterium tundrae]|uniref:Electron transfer flavoprotein small subunit n=1 Tax=Acetobacterium tundrae TaxID=132932 RepID=A0ABR6WM53_9FIRM|nr:electron transfer flavoprotein subunit beta/FixA family protein [Acetobacterium tundrae]MBC3797555.1 electron transfer flavoprotein subunit beta [Acetobacterium tundrae]